MKNGKRRFGGGKIFFSVFLISGILLLSAVAVRAQKNAPHRHEKTANMTGDWKKEISVVEVEAPDKKLKKENLVRSRNYEGFFVYREKDGYKIFFSDRKTKKIFEVRGAGLAWRPFSDLQWRNDQAFVFDSWSNPHHGAHYEINVRTRKVIKILIFEN